MTKIEIEEGLYVMEANNVKECIQQQAEARATFGAGLLEYFVLRNGKAFTPIAHNYKMGKKRECFMNATKFVYDNPGWTYTEGYAIRRGFGFLIHHAWVTDDNGNAVDLTWDRPEECEYFGVQFHLDVLTQQLVQHKVYGLLDHGMLNIQLMQAIDPTVTTYLDEQVEKRRKVREQITRRDAQ